MEQLTGYDAMISFDGGKTYQPCNLTDLNDFQGEMDAESNRQFQTYASATFTFHLEGAKPLKIRDTPPFWSAYK